MKNNILKTHKANVMKKVYVCNILQKVIMEKIYSIIHIIINVKKLKLLTNRIIMSGGVACNIYISNNIKKLICSKSYMLYNLPPSLYTDNSIMLAFITISEILEIYGDKRI